MKYYKPNNQYSDFFTEHFKYALINSAPWIQFQTRKNYAPWMTNELKDLMKKRDNLKKRAKELSILNKQNGNESSEDEKQLWGEYKIIRNKINNTKKYDKDKF